MPAICPECDSPIDVDEYDVDIGDELTCSECGTLLRVSGDSPLEFEPVDEDDEEVDDDDDDNEADDEESDDADDDDEFDDGDDEDEDGYRDEDE